jgi:hypothetical protein
MATSIKVIAINNLILGLLTALLGLSSNEY